jgi:valyl-tRNA synthetase
VSVGKPRSVGKALAQTPINPYYLLIMFRPDELPKAYNPSEVEDAIYKAWEESGVFNPDILEKMDSRFKDGAPYCIVMPPPNRTGTLHIGHSAMLAIEDLMIRFERMRGKKALWIPGTDHAAIATQVKVEQLLMKEGIKDPRKELGREKFLERVVAFAEDSANTMRRQIRKMGSSCDWSRECYTLDEQRNRAVNEVFKMMVEDGIIERGYRIVNWDPQFQTTLSDDEVLTKETTAKLLTFRYGYISKINSEVVKDKMLFPIEISTTRPETKFGDTAVAVHPDDERYKKFVGNVYTVDFCGRSITVKIISDKVVDRDFGTGALGVTPAHSMIDEEIAKNHDLPMVQVIGRDGKMTLQAGFNFKGLTVLEARDKVEKMLENAGLLTSIQEIPQNLPTAERGGATVEQLPMSQWFVRVNKKFKVRQDVMGKWKKGEEASLKELMIYAVEGSQIEIVPDRFKKIYFQWINNLRDWCISRQIWFGHPIPMMYTLDDMGVVRFDNAPLAVNISREEMEKIMEKASTIIGFDDDPEVEERRLISVADFRVLSELVKAGYLDWSTVKNNKPEIDPAYPILSTDFIQDKHALLDNEFCDPDTLDTWFSSGLWTFSTLGWPDIDAFEEMRAYHPTAVLETAYDIIFFWVARMILMSTYVLGEVPFKNVYLHGLVRDEQGRKMSKSLGNVLDPLDLIPKYGTDAVRLSLVVGTAPGQDSKTSEAKVEGFRNFTNKLWNISRYVLLQIGDKKIDTKSIIPVTDSDVWILGRLQQVTADVTKKLETYQFSVAGELLRDFTWNDFADWYLEIAKIEKDKEAILAYVMNRLLRLWHPFMPFVTEHIWQFTGSSNQLIIEAWPEVHRTFNQDDMDAMMHLESIRTLITDIRRLRAEQGIEPVKFIEIAIVSDETTKKIIEENSEVIKSLARLESLSFVDVIAEGWATTVSGTSTIGLNVAGAVDIEKEKAKLQKELAEVEPYIVSTKVKLENVEFTSKAPAHVIEGMKKKLEEAEGKKAAIEERIQKMTKE